MLTGIAALTNEDLGYVAINIEYYEPSHRQIGDGNRVTCP